jgi:DNA invertase Pin-like site-specific DNA recombinase
VVERANPKAFRCAIYTRKSSEEGLEQDFNSLQAQREACEAYIASQKHEGWKALPKPYDDGGYSGGSIERPALKQLLDDIKARRVDTVVVYKVDRLTRSLADFAKIVEIFDAQGVSFVSVTQQFNTTTSMGRLTLNVLLSFAQFEREVTGERIRDKFAASKKKGMWMGGFVPLGYRAKERTLVIHEAEAKIIRTIFLLYRETGSVFKVEAELDKCKIIRPLSKAMTSGRTYGDRPFTRTEIYRLLANPIYVGEIHHRGQHYEGQHPPIIDRRLWTGVREKLAANAPRRRIQRTAKGQNLLTGLIFDEQGNRFTPTHAIKNGKRYRYYFQQRAKHSKSEHSKSGQRPWRIAAIEIEKIIVEQLANHLEDRHWLLKHCISANADIANRKAAFEKGKHLAGQLRSTDSLAVRELLSAILVRTTLTETEVLLDIDRSRLNAAFERSSGLDAHFHTGNNEQTVSDNRKTASVRDTIPVTFAIERRRRGGETKLLILAPGNDPAKNDPDPTLAKLIAQAHQWWSDLSSARFATVRALADAYRKDERHVARVLTYALLAPSLIDEILEGRQAVGLTTQQLMDLQDLPHQWSRQVSVLRGNASVFKTGGSVENRQSCNL